MEPTSQRTPGGSASFSPHGESLGADWRRLRRSRKTSFLALCFVAEDDAGRWTYTCVVPIVECPALVITAIGSAARRS